MKKIIVAALMISVIIVSYICADTDYEVTRSKSLNPNIYEYIDQETGVHYLVYKGLKMGGITVRYNADGSLYTTKTDKENKK